MPLKASRCLNRFGMVFPERRFQMFNCQPILCARFFDLAFCPQRTAQGKMGTANKRGTKVRADVCLLYSQYPRCVGSRFFDLLQLHPEIGSSQKVSLEVVVSRWICFAN